MKTTRFLAIVFASALLTPCHVISAIVVPGADGSDGVLHVTENTQIDLSQAVTGNWDASNAANAGSGIYDPLKWAVVFKYSSVTVDPGMTLTFKNHSSRAPVVWLVSGDVTIEGTISLNGQSWQNAPALSDPGPGGFRGGTGIFSSGAGASAGFGVGGGGQAGGTGYAGSYGSRGGNGPDPYGNPSLIPLVGGSGGAGDNDRNVGGGAGGGALLIATVGTLTHSGIITSNGGAGISQGLSGPDRNSSGGSGGGVRLVADNLLGSGSIAAVGGGGSYSGGVGRIRVERVTNNNSLTITPDPSVVPLVDSDTVVLWPPPAAPEVKIISIGGEGAPADPLASFGAAGADVSLAETSNTPVVIETTNVEAASILSVRVTPRSNANATVVNAVRVDPPISTDPLVYRWTADLPVNVGYSAVQVKVVRP